MWTTVLDAGRVGGAAAQPVRRGGPRGAGPGAADWESDDGVRAATATCTGCTRSTTRALLASARASGHGDFDRSICAAVTGGWDTDSNGATVGSLVGALRRPRHPGRWTAPLKGRLASSVAGFDGSRFAAWPRGRWRRGGGG